MKTKHNRNVLGVALAAALIGALAFTSAQTLQVPIPTTAPEVPSPAPGPMTSEIELVP